MVQIAIVVSIIIVAMVFIGIGCMGIKSSKRKKTPVEMKGDMVPAAAPVEEEKVITPEKPKNVRKTPDYDTPDAWVLFGREESFDGWICPECGTENAVGNDQCMVCGREAH